MNDICTICGLHNGCEETGTPCEALKALHKIGVSQNIADKEALIRQYARQLGIIEYETCREMELLGEQVIEKMPELYFIRDYGIRVGYVISYSPKRNDGKIICGECRKITNTYTAFLPFDFVITFFEPNISYMSDNQKKLLMFHELKHIGIGPRGMKIEKHDIEDFEMILQRYGIRWNGFQSDVPDILVGGDSEKEKAAKKVG